MEDAQRWLENWTTTEAIDPSEGEEAAWVQPVMAYLVHCELHWFADHGYEGHTGLERASRGRISKPMFEARVLQSARTLSKLAVVCQLDVLRTRSTSCWLSMWLRL